MNNLNTKLQNTIISTLSSSLSVAPFLHWICLLVWSLTISTLWKRNTKAVFWKCFWLKVRKIIILPWKNWAGKNHRKWYEDLPTRFMPYFTTSLYLGGTKILVMWYYCTLAILFKTEDKKSDTTSCDILPGQNHMKCLAFYCKLSNTIGKSLRTSHFTFKKSLEAKIRMLLFSNEIFWMLFKHCVEAKRFMYIHVMSPSFQIWDCDFCLDFSQHGFHGYRAL